MKYSGSEKIVIDATAYGIEKKAFADCVENIEVEISSRVVNINRMAFLSKKAIKVKVIDDYDGVKEDETKSLYALENGEIVKREYSKSQYIKIKEEAKKFRLSFEYYHNYYEYTNRGRDEYRESIFYQLPFIPDDCILVENGHFYGAIYLRKDKKQTEYAVISKQSEKKVEVESDSERSEWGSYYSTESAILIAEEESGEKTLIGKAEARLYESL